MISYAVSLGSFGGLMTPALADAFRKSKLHNLELSFTPYTEESAQAEVSRELTRSLLKEKTVRSSSVHLPFYGGGVSWDPSAPDETARREVAARFIRLIRSHADMMAPHVTLHASNEPPLAEHPVRIDQACRTIEDLLPLAAELGFSINVEYLPRTCIGNCVEELQTIMSRFDPELVGICMDVNHIMDRWRELPEIIAVLAPRIRTFHINDYDGVDEMHWFPGQGILDWQAVMRQIRAISHDVLLIFETLNELGTKVSHVADPLFGIRQTEFSIWFLENCESVVPQVMVDCPVRHIFTFLQHCPDLFCRIQEKSVLHFDTLSGRFPLFIAELCKRDELKIESVACGAQLQKIEARSEHPDG